MLELPNNLEVKPFPDSIVHLDLNPPDGGAVLQTVSESAPDAARLAFSQSISNQRDRIGLVALAWVGLP